MSLFQKLFRINKKKVAKDNLTIHLENLVEKRKKFLERAEKKISKGYLLTTSPVSYAGKNWKKKYDYKLISGNPKEILVLRGEDMGAEVIVDLKMGYKGFFEGHEYLGTALILKKK